MDTWKTIQIQTSFADGSNMLYKYEAHIFQNGPEICGSNGEVLCVLFQPLIKDGVRGVSGVED
jgi:hypothetical protein